MPLSSMHRPITAIPYSTTRGNTRARLVSSPLTGSINGLPSGLTCLCMASAPRSAASMAIGTPTVSSTSLTAWCSTASSSTSAAPTLTPKTSAPAATCANASWRTASKSPATRAAASFFLPVGLIRSPGRTVEKDHAARSSIGQEPRSASSESSARVAVTTCSCCSARLMVAGLSPDCGPYQPNWA